MAKIVGYMDKVDFDEELGKNPHGCLVFPSIEALANTKGCIGECGIVEVRIELARIVLATEFKKMSKEEQEQRVEQALKEE